MQDDPPPMSGVAIAAAAALKDLRDFRHQTADNFAIVNIRLNAIDTRLNSIDVRLNGIDSRLDAMDARFDRVDAELREIRGRLGSVESLLVKIADKLGVAPPDPSLN